jgi:hypothetical protein
MNIPTVKKCFYTGQLIDFLYGVNQGKNCILELVIMEVPYA